MPMGPGVFSTDAKGVYFVQGPSGTILFNRKFQTATAAAIATGSIVKTGWPTTAGQCVDLFTTLASNTGAFTLVSAGFTSTATTGVAD